MIKNLTAVIFFALFFSSPHSFGGEAGLCRALFGVQSVGQDQIVYPAVLVELEDGSQVLAYSQVSLGVGHRGVLKKLKENFSRRNPIMHVLWMGELEFQTRPDGIEYLIAANEVSGYYGESLSAGGRTEDFDVQNRVGLLKKYLLTPRIDSSLGRTRILVAASTKFYSYKKNSSHLDIQLENLRLKFEQQNMSHGIPDLMQIFRLSFGRPYSSKLVADLLPWFDSYVSLLKILQKDFKTDIARMIQISETTLKTGELNAAALEELKQLHQSLAIEWRERPLLGDANIAVIQP